jgi:hypothetical protein
MSCCQYVSLQQLVILIDRLRNASLTDAERAEHERFLLKCVPSPAAVDFVRAPETHPANPEPGSLPSPEAMARILVAMR